MKLLRCSAINPFVSRLVAVFVVLSTSSWSNASPHSREKALQTIKDWSIQLDADAFAGKQPQMIIFNPAVSAAPTNPSSTPVLRMAYVSVGEADDRQSYWPRVANAAYLVKQDKETEGNTRVDFRDLEWQNLLLKEEIPKALSGRTRGLMLGNLDSIVDLEQKDPGHFNGNIAALKNWLAALRAAYPDLLLLAGGSAALETAAPYVDGYVVDPIFTEWDPAGHQGRRTTREERNERLDQIENAQVIATHPVFNLEYAGSHDKDLARWAVEESKKLGFRPFIKIR